MDILHEKGEVRLFDEILYFFYITNDRECEKEDVVFESNNRCNSREKSRREKRHVLRMGFRTSPPAFSMPQDRRPCLENRKVLP